MSAFPVPPSPRTTLQPAQDLLSRSIDSASSSSDSLLEDYVLPGEEEASPLVDNALASSPTVQADLNPAFISDANEILSQPSPVMFSTESDAPSTRPVTEKNEDTDNDADDEDQTVWFEWDPKVNASSIGILEMEFLQLWLYVDANGITWNELGRRVRDWLFEAKGLLSETSLPLYCMLPCQYRKKDRSHTEDYNFLPSDYMFRACMNFVLEWWRFQYKLICGSGES
ncbi:hypothetical protein RUND412_009434 [Rhizina undulata]